MKKGKTPRVITDKGLIDEILSRSIADILPTKEGLKKALLSGKRLRIYCGADATGPQLHIGHATNFMLLEKLRQLGHEIIVLFGDFTAMIGDPSDRTAVRTALTKKEVSANLATWKKQVSKVLSFTDLENPAKIVKNSHWWGKKDVEDMLRIASNFTAQQILAHNTFSKRIDEGKSVYLSEFFYPLLQGYDSVELDVDIEVGGSDQIFNMLAGRTLQKKYNEKEKFVLATTLLENPVTGKKLMSKSEGSFIALNDTPTEMFGKTMALADETIVQCFIDCTFLLMSEIEKIKKDLKSGGNPRDHKFRLAKELVTIYHGAKSAEEAGIQFNNVFQKKEKPQDIEEKKVSQKMMNIVDLIFKLGLSASKSEARRLVEQGGVKIDDSKITDAKEVLGVHNGMIVQVGKRKFVRIKV